MKKWSDLRIGDSVLYKNNQFIAFNKPAGLPVQPDRSADKSLLDLGEIYAQSSLELIHRLDRPASGVVLFAKNKNGLAALNQQFQERSVKKEYLALVKEPPAEAEGTLRHLLKKDGRKNKSFIVEAGATGAKEAILNYRVLGQTQHYTLLQIELVTGRHHQIRAQLAAMGNPIKGDVRYGFKRANQDRSIHLHAWKLAFTHPVAGTREHIEAPLPEDPAWAACEEIINNFNQKT